MVILNLLSVIILAMWMVNKSVIVPPMSVAAVFPKRKFTREIT